MKKHEIIISEVEKIIPEVYLVGGSVRDLILGVEPHDYDFTTPLSPDEVEALVKKAGRKCYSIGKKFGTIGFKVPVSKIIGLTDDDMYASPVGNYTVEQTYEYVEVTTFRTEQYDGKSRKPEVQFVDDLLLDLSRRDFTVNAIALRNGEFIDPFGGRLDILSKKIKAVGKGKDRFNEDPLRMLRAARFVSKLGFDLDPNLIGDMRKCSKQILNVSKERWVIELDKILTSGNSDKAFDILHDGYVLKYILPEFDLSIIDNIFESTKSLEAVDSLTDNNPDMAWKSLLDKIGYPFVKEFDKKRCVYKYNNHELIRRELIIGICHRLKFSNQRTKILLG